MTALLNRQERFRTKVSSNVDDYTTHMFYLQPFLRSVQAEVATVMSSYNLINSSWASQVSPKCFNVAHEAAEID